jgi:hypothetical protein
VGVGIILQVAGWALSGAGDTGCAAGLLLIIGGWPVFIWGCLNYAEGKGHSKWVGLVGLAGCIGLVVLAILPDLRKEGRDAAWSLLGEAAALERRGDIAGAVAKYEEVKSRFPGTDASKDAEIGIENLNAMRGEEGNP